MPLGRSRTKISLPLSGLKASSVFTYEYNGLCTYGGPGGGAGGVATVTAGSTAKTTLPWLFSISCTSISVSAGSGGSVTVDYINGWIVGFSYGFTLKSGQSYTLLVPKYFANNFISLAATPANFQSWTTTGGVAVVGQNTSPTITIDVNSEGTLTANFS